MVLRPELGTYISVCSGAGGLDLGVRMALPGARTVCFVEHEIPACEILAARIAEGALDEAPVWTDLHAFDGRPWRGRVGGIVGGYPCQPFSVAGKRLGTEDPRHLWPAIERLIDTVAPLWCVFENVPNHLNLGYYDVVKPGLESLGFRVKEGLFTASEVGASHRRQRLFILALADAGSEGLQGGERGGAPAEWDGASPHGPAPELRGVPVFAPRPGDDAAWRTILAERPDLAPALTKSEFRGMADGLAARLDKPTSALGDLSRTQKLRLTGNGVVPAQAELAVRYLARQMAEELQTRW